MQRDEKMFDARIEALIQRVQELRTSVLNFIIKLEQEYATLDWPSVLNNFALLSGQLAQLNTCLKADQMPPLKNFAIFPLLLSQQHDPEVEKLTEGRIACVNHEVAPAYLRTKPEPEVEEKITKLIQTSQLSQEIVQKQLTMLNKQADLMLNVINQAREARGKSENARQSDTTRFPTPSATDTNILIAAITFGKSLKPSQRPTTPGSGQASSATEQRVQLPTGPQGMPTMNKAPSAIKTNIKSAASSHPYGRP